MRTNNNYTGVLDKHRWHGYCHHLSSRYNGLLRVRLRKYLTRQLYGRVGNRVFDNLWNRLESAPYGSNCGISLPITY